MHRVNVSVIAQPRGTSKCDIGLSGWRARERDNAQNKLSLKIDGSIPTETTMVHSISPWASRHIEPARNVQREPPRTEKFPERQRQLPKIQGNCSVEHTKKCCKKLVDKKRKVFLHSSVHRVPPFVSLAWNRETVGTQGRNHTVQKHASLRETPTEENKDHKFVISTRTSQSYSMDLEMDVGRQGRVVDEQSPKEYRPLRGTNQKVSLVPLPVGTQIWVPRQPTALSSGSSRVVHHERHHWHVRQTCLFDLGFQCTLQTNHTQHNAPVRCDAMKAPASVRPVRYGMLDYHHG